MNFDASGYKRNAKVDKVLEYVALGLGRNEKLVIYSQFLGAISILAHEFSVLKYPYVVNSFFSFPFP